MIIASAFKDGRTRDLVKKEIFEHPDWLELDRGSLSPENAIRRGALRTGLPASDIERLLHSVPVFLTPIDETIDLIRRLSLTANKLFILSNMHLASIAHLEEKHDIWRLFDGIVISSRIGTVKPEARIYEHLLETYRLEPTETVFIDDMPENLDAAAALGIRTIRFLNTTQCEQALVEHQVL
jgi:putative hydrolase of the HAD superfamily